jgi:hypothetical protein
MNRMIFTIILATALSPLAFAQPAKEGVHLDDVVNVIEGWGRDPLFIRAAEARNAMAMSDSVIDLIDKRWIAGGEQARVHEIANNGCAVHLKSLVASNPAFSESFVMDAHGANICMTQRTTDFWQGDEPKWQKSFNRGAGGVFVDQPKYDPSAKGVLVQVSVPIMSRGRAIGAITVGVNLNKLAGSSS